MVMCCKKAMGDIAAVGIMFAFISAFSPNSLCAKIVFKEPTAELQSYNNIDRKSLCGKFAFKNLLCLWPTVTAFPIFILSVKRERKLLQFETLCMYFTLPSTIVNEKKLFLSASVIIVINFSFHAIVAGCKQ